MRSAGGATPFRRGDGPLTLEPAGLRQAPGRPGSSGHCLQDVLVLRVFPGGPAAVPEMIAAAIAEGRRARGTLAVAGAGMRARSYHASPGEITSVGGCAQDSSMNCASTPDGGAVPADVPGETLAAPPPVTRTDAVWLAGLGEHPEGIAPVPAPDSYPHVTCGCPVTGRRPHGVVAAVARRHRERGMAVTTTLAPWRRPASPPRRTGPRPAGQQPRCPGLLPGFPGDDRPAGHLGGQEHPFGEGRAPRPAGAPAPGPPARRGSRGRGCVPRGRGPGHGQARIRGPTAPACYRYRPGRSGQIGGPAGRSHPAVASDPGWA